MGAGVGALPPPSSEIATKSSVVSPTVSSPVVVAESCHVASEVPARTIEPPLPVEAAAVTQSLPALPSCSNASGGGGRRSIFSGGSKRREPQ